MNENYVTLGQVCTKGSSNIAQKDLAEREGQYPIYGAAGLIKNVDFAHQKQSYIAVVKDGAGIGRVMKLPAYSSVIGTMQYIFPKENVDIDYLFYALQHMNLGKYFSGSTIPHIYFRDYQKERLKLPVMEVQQRQADTLSRIDALSAYGQRQIALMDEIVKSRFVEMFGLPGTDAHGWGMSSLGEICEINPKKSQDARLTNGLLVSFVSMPSVSESGDIDTTQVKPYDEVKTGFTYFAENDVLFAKITPCMENGKGAVATGLYNGIGFGSTEFHVLRPAKETATPCWIYTLTVFPQFRIDAASNMTGSAGQRRVPASFLENYRVSVPPLELQNRFAAFVAEVDKSKFRIQKSLSTSRKLWTMAQIDAIMNMDFSTQRSL